MRCFEGLTKRKEMNTKNTADYKQPAPAPATGAKAFRTFEDLEVYQAAREFRKLMYQANRQLPAFEKFELGSQIRRAAVSLTNNIAEGHGRFHYLEQIKFCLNARGSLEELLDDLNVCEDESYLPLPEIQSLRQHGWRVHQVLNGYIRWLRQQKQGNGLELREDSSAYGLTDDQLDDLLEGDQTTTASTLHTSTLQR
jgi:four helix bundle protein